LPIIAYITTKRERDIFAAESYKYLLFLALIFIVETTELSDRTHLSRALGILTDQRDTLNLSKIRHFFILFFMFC